MKRYPVRPREGQSSKLNTDNGSTCDGEQEKNFNGGKKDRLRLLNEKGTKWLISRGRERQKKRASCLSEKGEFGISGRPKNIYLRSGPARGRKEIERNSRMQNRGEKGRGPTGKGPNLKPTSCDLTWKKGGR